MAPADQDPQPNEQEHQDATHQRPPRFEPEEAAVFAQALRLLAETGIPHALGGALALHSYTGIWRDTKDLDVFLKPADLATAFRALAGAGRGEAAGAGRRPGAVVVRPGSRGHRTPPRIRIPVAGHLEGSVRARHAPAAVRGGAVVGDRR